MQGNLSHISLNDVLLIATGGKKSGVLKLTRGKETVEVFFVEGNIVHATCPIGEGEKALLYPVTWGDGSFTLQANGTAPSVTINKNSAEILDEVKAMSREWETILSVIPSGKTVFRIADLGEDQTGPITVPNVGWRVLSKIDGARNVQEITELLRIPYAYTAKVIFNLHKAKLIEMVPLSAQSPANVVPPGLLNSLTSILTEVIGPMAPLVLRDHIEALGESTDSVPESKLDELIALIGRDISNPSQRKKFEKSIFQEISNFKKL